MSLVKMFIVSFCCFLLSGSWQKRREPLGCETLESLIAIKRDLHFYLLLLDNCLTIARDCQSVSFNAITNKSLLLLRWSFTSVFLL